MAYVQDEFAPGQVKNFHAPTQVTVLTPDRLFSVVVPFSARADFCSLRKIDFLNQSLSNHPLAFNYIVLSANLSGYRS